MEGNVDEHAHKCLNGEEEAASGSNRCVGCVTPHPQHAAQDRGILDGAQRRGDGDAERHEADSEGK